MFVLDLLILPFSSAVQQNDLHQFQDKIVKARQPKITECKDNCLKDHLDKVFHLKTFGEPQNVNSFHNSVCPILQMSVNRS